MDMHSWTRLTQLQSRDSSSSSSFSMDSGITPRTPAMASAKGNPRVRWFPQIFPSWHLDPSSAALRENPAGKRKADHPRADRAQRARRDVLAICSAGFRWGFEGFKWQCVIASNPRKPSQPIPSCQCPSGVAAWLSRGGMLGVKQRSSLGMWTKRTRQREKVMGRGVITQWHARGILRRGANQAPQRASSTNSGLSPALSELGAASQWPACTHVQGVIRRQIY
ncbi:hypothetical protein F5884DRAFT_382982 [Xylogone sp. PMI_703]|nr:hypothetical protein F5884DRAFT_382982 [Xylogone sp. PMI_703]